MGLSMSIFSRNIFPPSGICPFLSSSRQGRQWMHGLMIFLSRFEQQMRLGSSFELSIEVSFSKD